MAVEEEQAFFRAIRARPDDDLPRLVYADWLDEHDEHDRAQFIRIQCELASGTNDGEPLSDERRRALEAREAELFAGHRAEWEAPLRALGATSVGFRQGLAEDLTITAANFVENAEALFELAPICGLRLGDNRIGSDGAVALAASPHLAKLTTLDLGGNDIGSAGARALAASPHLAKLTTLGLDRNRIGAAVLREVERTLANRHRERDSRGA